MDRQESGKASETEASIAPGSSLLRLGKLAGFATKYSRALGRRWMLPRRTSRRMPDLAVVGDKIACVTLRRHPQTRL